MAPFLREGVKAMNALPGKLVWVEHASADPAKASQFYETLFGWTDSPMDVAGSPYRVIMNAGQGIGGYRTARGGEPGHWGIYLSVADVDATFAMALVAGATPWMPPSDFPPVGRGASLIDPVGAMFSIWRGANDDTPDAEVPPGHWVWHELHATDAEKALAFYEQLFGLTHDATPAGDGTYYVLKAGELRRGGIMKTPGTSGKSLWLPYVLVPDVDAATAKAALLHAEVCMHPSDIPGLGRFATLRDPLGAVFAVFLPQPRQ
jgi:predicted enzyme related to lactoylglutathione lyase